MRERMLSAQRFVRTTDRGSAAASREKL